MSHYVQVPDWDRPHVWSKTLADFPRKVQAIAFAKRIFGADDQGRIRVVNYLLHERVWWVSLPDRRGNWRTAIEQGFEDRQSAILAAQELIPGLDANGRLRIVFED